MNKDTTPPVEGSKELTAVPRRDIITARVGVWIRRVTWAAIITLPLFYMMAALGTRWGWWSLRTGFGTLSRDIGPKLIIATLIIGVICLVLTLLSKQKRKGLIVSAFAILTAVSAMAYGAKVRASAQKLPFIHDITTNTQDVPTFSKAVLDIRAQTNGVNSVEYIGKMDQRDKELYSVLQTRAYPDIRPLILSGNPEQVFGQALATVNQMGWKIHTQDADKGIIEATATSFWYGFKDDVIIRIHAAEGGGTVLDMRSISRVGQSDLGANAARIRKFLAQLK